MTTLQRLYAVSRVDTRVDRRLEAIGTEEALESRRRAAVAQATLAGFDESFQHVLVSLQGKARQLSSR